MQTYETVTGERIEDVCAKLVRMARLYDEPVVAQFNEIVIVAYSRDDPPALIKRFLDDYRRLDEARANELKGARE